MSSADWTVAPHPVPPELEDNYPAHQYGDITRFPTIADKLDAATIHQLMELARGGIGEPDAHT